MQPQYFLELTLNISRSKLYFMIDPNHITNYNLSEKELQYNLMFWLLVAGKTAKVAAS